MLEDLPDQGAELWRAGQVGAVAREIDAGQHDFTISVVDEAAQPLRPLRPSAPSASFPARTG